MVQDPVCMMTINPQHAAGMLDYEGKKYYFCSDNCLEKFRAQPSIYLNQALGMHLTIGVMGSADFDEPEHVRQMAYELGKVIAQKEYVLITGACPGLPYECARGVSETGGMSIGISPALSLDEHIHKYDSPSDTYDVIIYTGSGLMGREVTNIRSSDMVILVGGQSGTLGEFAIAYDEGKLIGVLEGSGGITSQLPDLIKSLRKQTGAMVIYENNPQELVEKMVNYYSTEHYRRPSCFCSE